MREMICKVRDTRLSGQGSGDRLQLAGRYRYPTNSWPISSGAPRFKTASETDLCCGMSRIISFDRSSSSTPLLFSAASCRAAGRAAVTAARAREMGA